MAHDPNHHMLLAILEEEGNT
ncbi:uncharacterized protein G2W53_035458 [Senna tora]|uniref:Uncharacterized protein n=1 Tax=Senna tora TaxID=362788 RepID=A0A834W403_9FABA|nr:uncharacterized protein G2W53_035458 [Senna tora]